MKTFIGVVFALLIIAVLWFAWQAGLFSDEDVSLTLRDRLLMSEITIPNIDQPIALEERDRGDGTSFVGGEYQSTEDEFVRAFVSIEDTHTVELPNGRATAPWYVIPMYINYGGTGTFLTLGLYETTGNRVVLHETVFVGDRVTIQETFVSSAGEVVLDCLTRKSDEAMAAVPTVPARAVVERDGTQLILVRDMVNATEDDIRVTAPDSGATVTVPITVRGSARGPWYFEANFGIEIVNDQFETIGQGFATAQGEWMTEEFVPFEAEVEIEGEYAGPATLILRNANASGLPEREAHVSVPIVIGE